MYATKNAISQGTKVTTYQCSHVYGIPNLPTPNVSSAFTCISIQIQVRGYVTEMDIHTVYI